MLTTTLGAIFRRPHGESLRDALLQNLKNTEGDNDPIPMATVLDIIGIQDALHVLGSVCGDAGVEICASFAADCAERVLPTFESAYPDDKRPRAAIIAVRERVKGVAVDEIYSAAYDAAEAASDGIVRAAAIASTRAIDVMRAWTVFGIDGEHAAYSSMYTANVAINATRAPSAEREWQQNRLRELLESAS